MHRPHAAVEFVNVLEQHYICYYIITNTVGSHVMVYNASHYGNIYRESMQEYLK